MPLMLELQIKKPLTNMDQALKVSGPICFIKMFLLDKFRISDILNLVLY